MKEKDSLFQIVADISNIAAVLSDTLLLKFIYSEKATKFCEIFALLLTVCTVVKSKVKISQNCVAFSEFMNFNINILIAFFNGMKLTDSRCFAA